MKHIDKNHQLTLPYHIIQCRRVKSNYILHMCPTECPCEDVQVLLQHQLLSLILSRAAPMDGRLYTYTCCCVHCTAYTAILSMLEIKFNIYFLPFRFLVFKAALIPFLLLISACYGLFLIIRNMKINF